jgi:CheY-like chemotaxis protein
VGVEKFSASAPGAFDAILMDIRMPVMNGYEATRSIRSMERPDAKTIPIIAMTADAFEEDLRRAKDAGMDDYLTKPVDASKVYAALSRRFSGSLQQTRKTGRRAFAVQQMPGAFSFLYPAACKSSGSLHAHLTPFEGASPYRNLIILTGRSSSPHLRGGAENRAYFARRLPGADAFACGKCTCGANAGSAMDTLPAIWPLRSCCGLAMPSSRAVGGRGVGGRLPQAGGRPGCRRASPRRLIKIRR